MGLQFENSEIDRLVAGLVRFTGESEETAVAVALQERTERLRHDRVERINDAFAYLEEHFWPLIDPDVVGRRVSHEEEDSILGYGTEGFCV